MTADPTRRAMLIRASSFIAASIVSSMLPATVSAESSRTTQQPPARRFKIKVPDATLLGIRNRVRNVHWPVTSKGAGWRYGVDAVWFRELITYWRDEFDWRAAEAVLNRTPQYLAAVEGRDVHFARLEPKQGSSKRPPLMLLHGWPYTFATMLPLAERLSNEGFEVIVPSLPGTAFSQAADDQVRGLRVIAQRLDRLMTQTLGHMSYLVHGGDFGAVVADWLAIDVPKHLIGIHANMVAFRHAGAGYGSGQTAVPDATQDEVAYARAEVENMDRESAYFRLQLTRPETLVYALSDSPVGWAAYMLDKWQKWTDTRVRPIQAIYDRDRLLTEVMLFLVNDSVATSIWPYAGFATEPFGLEPGQKIMVPFAYSSFADPLMPRIPRRFVERSRADIRLWREHEKGGHFPMLEETDVLASDIIAFAERVS